MARRRKAATIGIGSDGLEVSERKQLHEFARRLQKRLAEKGWSQSDLARAAFGTTRDSAGYVVARKRDRISVYMSGRCRPDSKNLKAIADAVGVTPTELLPDSAIGTEYPREINELFINQTPGHPGYVQLRVNQLVPAGVAAQVLTLLATHQNGHTEA